jgi:hypothetical protein
MADLKAASAKDLWAMQAIETTIAAIGAKIGYLVTSWPINGNMRIAGASLSACVQILLTRTEQQIFRVCWQRIEASLLRPSLSPIPIAFMKIFRADQEDRRIFK